MTSDPIPIRKVTLSGQVAERLREAILAGAYGLGSQLNEVEIARQYGVSRGPVREAIQRLVQEGLLQSEPHRGVFLPDLNDDDLADIYHARNAIEGAALRTVLAAGLGPALSENLFDIVEQMKAAERVADWNRVAQLDMSFHSLIVDMAASHRLMRMYHTLIAEMKVCLQLLLGGYRGRDGIVETHVKLAELIAKGDVEACIRELGHHLDEPVQSLQAERKSLLENRAAEEKGETSRGTKGVGRSPRLRRKSGS
ncbi:MAG: GntR family transcriptional regulator [Geminicoccaceae bacterium]